MKNEKILFAITLIFLLAIAPSVQAGILDDVKNFFSNVFKGKFTLAVSTMGGRTASNSGDSNWAMEGWTYPSWYRTPQDNLDQLLTYGSRTNTVVRGEFLVVRLVCQMDSPSSEGCYGYSPKDISLVADLGTAEEKVLKLEDDGVAGTGGITWFNTSQLSAGSHALDFVHQYPYDEAKRLGSGNGGFGEWRGVQSYTGNNMAWDKIFIEPAICKFDPETEGGVSRVFTAGKTISKSTLTDYPPIKFCDTPTRILRADTGEILTDYQLSANLEAGKTILIPPSQVQEIVYIAKKTWSVTCIENQVYSPEQNKCIVSGLTRPCGDNAILLEDGTCIEFPNIVCPGGTFYDDEVGECIDSRCPEGSKWESTISACGKQVRYTDLCSKGRYNYESDSCVRDELPELCMGEMIGGGQLMSSLDREATDEKLTTINAKGKELYAENWKPITECKTWVQEEGKQFDVSDPKAHDGGAVKCVWKITNTTPTTCSMSADYTCEEGMRLVKDDYKHYFCAYGVEALKTCSQGAETIDGNCVFREELVVDRVIIEKEFIEREVPVPYEVIVEKPVDAPEKPVVIAPKKKGIWSNLVDFFGRILDDFKKLFGQ